ATPVAIMAGTNVAAERGILIRDGIALEKSGKLTAVVFDKTGTLTEGRLIVDAHETLTRAGHPIEDADAIAASLAAASSHPLSQAVAKLSDARIALSDWQEIRGSGLQARLAENDRPSRRDTDAHQYTGAAQEG